MDGWVGKGFNMDTRDHGWHLVYYQKSISLWTWLSKVISCFGANVLPESLQCKLDLVKLIRSIRCIFNLYLTFIHSEDEQHLVFLSACCVTCWINMF